MKRKGFTLIELLVVIAIIAILAAMLMPSLEKAREAAQMTSCLNQNKQMALGMAQYSLEYAEYIANNSDCGPTVPKLTCALWDTYPEFQGGITEGRRSPDRCLGSNSTSSIGQWCNKIFPYVPVMDMFICSEWEVVNGPMHFESAPNTWVGSVDCDYGVNEEVLVENVFIKTTDLTHSGDTIMVGHAITGERDRPMFDRDHMDDPFWNAWVHMRTTGDEVIHGGTTFIIGPNPFLFGDYHAEAIHWEEHNKKLDIYYTL